MTPSRDERDALVKRLEAFADREWKKRKQDGLARGLEMVPPAGEYEQLLLDAIAALTAQGSAGEPVAWMHYDKDGAHFPSLYDWNNPRIGYTVRPMYFRGDMPAILCRHPGDAHQSPSPESRGEVVVPSEVHAATINAYEECAKVCEESQTNGPSSENFMALKCASAIRSHPEYHAALAAAPMTAASGMDEREE